MAFTTPSGVPQWSELSADVSISQNEDLRDYKGIHTYIYIHIYIHVYIYIYGVLFGGLP